MIPSSIFKKPYRLKRSFISLFFLLILSQSLFGKNIGEERSIKAQWIHALASLDFFLKESVKERAPLIEFSTAEVEKLWERIKMGAYSSKNPSRNIHLFNQAFEANKQSILIKADNDSSKAKYWNAKARLYLKKLWDRALEEEIPGLLSPPTLKQPMDPHLLYNRLVPPQVKTVMAPYHLPLNHETRSVLDALFSLNRVTQDEESFTKAGFEIIAKGPRSYIVVAKHEQLPGYLIKAHFDSETQKKHHKESWEWLVKRCEGAQKIRTIIKKLQIQRFKVPLKWLYCFKEEPAPPEDEAHTRHLALVLVEDMQLIPYEENKMIWKQQLSRVELDELFMIITRAKGSSYRPDNIAYTKNGDFAFIDTEYPSYGPDFKSIRRYLSVKMRDYWDNLIKNGGPS